MSCALLRILLVLCTCLLGAARVRAEAPRPVPVRVIEIAGGSAFLSAGTGQGLRVGSPVLFGALERRVERATRSYAVVSARRLRVGDRGLGHGVAAEGELARLPKPRPPSAFVGQWPVLELPSTRQHPMHVPLGGPLSAPRGMDASLTATGTALVPRERERAVVSRAELRARISTQPTPDLPLRLVGDVAVQRWFGRYATGIASSDPRPWLRVRELSVELGKLDGYRAQLGRLRYAAVNLGPLDGGRFETAHWGRLRVAAFGGLLPDPVDGRFARDAGRFGAELSLRDERLTLRPELTIVVQGSTFDGRLDERRLYAQAALWPGEQRVGAYAEATRFDADNPWGRPTLDLTSAGADVDLRFGGTRLGGRFDMRKPERSYWLARTFPDGWLCGTSRVDVRCSAGDDTRYLAQGFGGLGIGRAQLDVGASWAGSSEAALGQHALGHATLRLPRVGRYDLAFGGSHEGGSLLRASSAVRTEVGVRWLDEAVHLSVYYRPARKRYAASLAGLWEHGTGVSLHVAPTPALTLDLFGDVRIGDVDAALVMLSAMYRMRR